MVEKLRKAWAFVARLADVRWRWWWTIAFVLLGTLVLWTQASPYLPFFADDSFISLRYTERLLQGRGLTWTDGERVEGYSNLLWVLVTALPGVFGADLVGGARGVGLSCMALTFWAFVVAARPRRFADGLVPFLAILLVSSIDSIAVWSIGGLEPPLVIALLTWGVVSASRAVEEASDRRWAMLAAASFGLLCWTRPDGPLWAVAATVALALAHRLRAARTVLWIAGAVALFVGLQLAFRLAYYGDYLPNTAYAKVALTENRWLGGLKYLNDSLMPLAAGWLALALGITQGLLRKATRGTALMLLVMSATWVYYVVKVGGDIFPAWRHWHYLMGLSGLAFIFVLRNDAEREAEPKKVHAPSALRYGLALIVLAFVGTHFDPGNWAKIERWEWDGMPVGLTLKRAFGKKEALLAVDASGATPFFSRLPTLDLLGLSDRYLAHNRPQNIGTTSALGHELGDADYYLRREPDIFCFGVPPCSHGAKYPAQVQMVRKPAFAEQYLPVRLQARGGKQPLVSEVWIRRNGRIGIVQSDKAVRIPGHLLATNRAALGVLPKGASVFEVQLPPRTSTRIDRIRLSPGTWTLRAEALRGGGALRVYAGPQQIATGAADAPVTMTLSQPTDVKLSVEADQRGLTTQGLSLRAN
jgi:hypothetical protein